MDLSNDVVIHIKNKEIEYLQFRKLLELGINHAYTVKSKGYNFNRKHNPEWACESFKALCDELNIDYNNLVRPYQRHTNRVECVDKVTDISEDEGIDGVLTDKKGLSLATTNGDCILYLVYDPKRNVIGSIHSGWRGTYERIIEHTIDLMKEKYGSKEEDILIFICPSIRKCHFEVENDVETLFEERFGFLDNINDIILNSDKEGKFYIDTVKLNNTLLIKKGIKEENIYDSNICSVCNKELIGSYRVEGKAFTAAAAIIVL